MKYTTPSCSPTRRKDRTIISKALLTQNKSLAWRSIYDKDFSRFAWSLILSSVSHHFKPTPFAGLWNTIIIAIMKYLECHRGCIAYQSVSKIYQSILHSTGNNGFHPFAFKTDVQWRTTTVQIQYFIKLQKHKAALTCCNISCNLPYNSDLG